MICSFSSRAHMSNIEQTIISAPDRWGRQMSIVLLPSGQYAIACNGRTLPDCVWEASEREIEECARTLLQLTEASESRWRALENPAYSN
jgi:hypothetical protein